MSDALVKSEVVDRLAERVAALLEPRLVEALTLRTEESAGSLVDAQVVADALGLTRSTVYARADELGAVRLGNGRKPRLRFDLDRARAALDSSAEPADRATAPSPRRPSRRPRQPNATTASGTPLLPVRDRKGRSA